MKSTIAKTLIAAALTGYGLTTLASESSQTQYDAPVSMTLTFRFHLDDELPEQDVFVQRESGSQKVYRVTNADRDMSLPLYAAARPLEHNPFDPAQVGPWPIGQTLGISLGEWLQAEGQASYGCENGVGNIQANFSGLVPDSVYTVWHYFIALPPTEPFIGTYDLPLGARDGSQAAFNTDGQGNAVFEQRFRPCLQLSGEHLTSGLAIAYHSDGKTYGPLPGDFASNSHIHMYVGLPQRSGL